MKLTRVTAWMNLKDLALSEGNQSPTYYTMPLIWNVQNWQIHRHGRQVRGYRALGLGASTGYNDMRELCVCGGWGGGDKKYFKIGLW